MMGILFTWVSIKRPPNIRQFPGICSFSTCSYVPEFQSQPSRVTLSIAIVFLIIYDHPFSRAKLWGSEDTLEIQFIFLFVKRSPGLGSSWLLKKCILGLIEKLNWIHGGYLSSQEKSLSTGPAKVGGIHLFETTQIISSLYGIICGLLLTSKKQQVTRTNLETRWAGKAHCFGVPAVSFTF